MEATTSTWDLVKTIESDDENIPVYDSSSESEEEFQPKQLKRDEIKAKSKAFSQEFEFIGSVGDYNADPWKDDVQKYIKRKAKSKTDDKIAKVLKDKGMFDFYSIFFCIVLITVYHYLICLTGADEDGSEQEVEDEVEEDLLSEDELKKDNVRDKEKDRKRKLRKKKTDEEIDQNLGMGENFFDESLLCEPAASFHEMNLSRPLMKAIASMNFVHPTPIQSATIPVALLGRDICGCAATGTGKTAAFMLPVLERLMYRPKLSATTRVLVLVPTRELGVQVRLQQFTFMSLILSKSLSRFIKYPSNFHSSQTFKLGSRYGTEKYVFLFIH